MLWTACQKEELADLGNGGIEQEDVDSRIAAFVSNSEHHASEIDASRSEDNLSTDSATWYVEGGLNYSLAQAWLSHNDITTDSTSIEIPVNDGEVAASDAGNAYTILKATLESAIEPGESHLILADITPELMGASLKLKVNYILGSGGDRTGPPNTSYPSNILLNWYTIGSGSSSSCDPNVFSTLGADKTIEFRVAYSVLPVLYYGDYYSSLETWSIDPSGSPSAPDLTYHIYGTTFFVNPNNTSGHPNQNYWTWMDVAPNTSLCLDASDMAYHTQGTYDAMEYIRTHHCSTKVAAHIDVTGDLSAGGSGPFHWVYYTYGKILHRKLPR